MKNGKRFFCLLTLVLFCLALLAGCGSSGREWRDDDVIDDYGTITRNGKQIDVCVCHDLEAVYLYYDNEKHDYFDTAMLPTEELYDKDWLLGGVDFSDRTGDNNGDLQVTLYHGDMSESQIVWSWEEGTGFVYQPDYSWFYKPGVIIDPPGDDTADFSVYAGVWLPDADNQYDVMYIEFDEEGNWQLYSGGESIDKGCLWYDSEDDAVYVRSDLGGVADCGRAELEGDRLYITTLGNFTHVVSEEDQDYTDFSAYEGTWLGDADDTQSVTYIEFNGEGIWQLYSDGESIDQGYLWYDSEDEAVYIHSDLGGAADGGRVELEGDRLYITTLGYFTHIVSEEDQDYTDFSAYQGTWYLDEDSSAEAYVIIDGDGSWSYCRRAAGEDAATEIDRGTLSDSGEADILYADSAVNDGVRYLVFEMDENILIWGDEGAYYRIVG